MVGGEILLSLRLVWWLLSRRAASKASLFLSYSAPTDRCVSIRVTSISDHLIRKRKKSLANRSPDDTEDLLSVFSARPPRFKAPTLITKRESLFPMTVWIATLPMGEPSVVARTTHILMPSESTWIGAVLPRLCSNWIINISPVVPGLCWLCTGATPPGSKGV